VARAVPFFGKYSVSLYLGHPVFVVFGFPVLVLIFEAPLAQEIGIPTPTLYKRILDGRRFKDCQLFIKKAIKLVN
jgi:hypothetical protein